MAQDLPTAERRPYLAYLFQRLPGGFLWVKLLVEGLLGLGSGGRVGRASAGQAIARCGLAAPVAQVREPAPQEEATCAHGAHGVRPGFGRRAV